MKFKENWLFQGPIHNSYVCLSSIVTLTKQLTNVRWHLVDMEEENLSRQIVTNDPQRVPSGLFMPISFCLYLFCTIFHYASKLPCVIERLFYGNHSDLSSSVVVAEEKSWRLLTKMAFLFCNRIFNGPRRTSFIPSVFDPDSAEGLFVPRRAPKLIRCMSSSLIKENTSHKRKAHILTFVILWHVA